MQDELAAAQATLPAKEAVHREAVSCLQAAQGELASAALAVEVCADLAAEFTGHLNTALAVEATIRSVLEALRERAARGDPGMGAAAERITSSLRKAREEAGVPRDNENGRRLLDALATDPTARLT
jgi:hypothetical protein